MCDSVSSQQFTESTEAPLSQSSVRKTFQGKLSLNHLSLRVPKVAQTNVSSNFSIARMSSDIHKDTVTEMFSIFNQLFSPPATLKLMYNLLKNFINTKM